MGWGSGEVVGGGVPGVEGVDLLVEPAELLRAGFGGPVVAGDGEFEGFGGDVGGAGIGGGFVFVEAQVTGDEYLVGLALGAMTCHPVIR